LSESRVFVITGASTGHSRRTSRWPTTRVNASSSPARSADKLAALAASPGGDAGDRGAHRRHRLRRAGGWSRSRFERFRAVDVVFANRRFGAKRGIPLEETPSSGARW